MGVRRQGLLLLWAMIGTMYEISEYPVAEVGGWLHASRGSPSAREIAARPDFWPDEFYREELTRRIRSAGGVQGEYALEARRLRNGEVLLLHGCHRWAVAHELGMPSVPVMMGFEVEPGHEAWSTWD